MCIYIYIYTCAYLYHIISYHSILYYIMLYHNISYYITLHVYYSILRAGARPWPPALADGFQTGSGQTHECLPFVCLFSFNSLDPKMTKCVSFSCQDRLKFTKSVSFPSAFRQLFVLVTRFRSPVSRPVKDSCLWQSAESVGATKKGVRKPKVYRFPQLPLFKHMPSCLGQWSATHFLKIEGIRKRKTINRRFTNPPFRVLPSLAAATK